MDKNPEKRARLEERKGFSLGNPPDPDKHFYIDNEDDVRSVLYNISKGNFYLIRGPPAAGKSTLAQAIRRHAPYSKRGPLGKRSFVLVSGNDMKAMHNNSELCQEFVDQLNDEANLNGALPKCINFRKALKFLHENNVVMVMDEAHVIFKKMYEILKSNSATAIFFTTTPEEVVITKGRTLITAASPPGIASKFYWSGGIKESGIERALQQTEVRLTLEAIRALVQISGVHRGIFNRLCFWVLDRQRAAAGRKVFFCFQHRHHTATNTNGNLNMLTPRHDDTTSTSTTSDTHTRAHTYRHNHHHHTRP